MPARYLIANWKMNVPPEGIGAYVAAARERLRGRGRVVIAPPFVHLRELAAALDGSDLQVGAQNCADQPSGAFTGEVSAAMVRDAGARYVILGHSERRALYGETPELVARKLTMAIESGLIPILCVGEDERVREEGQALVFVAEQVRAAMVPALERAERIVVAYEPVWAIGSGRNASGTVVAEMISTLRETLRRFLPVALSGDASVLYGGSVTPDNASELVAIGKVDGFLVGGASLDSTKFAALHAALEA